jgi:hypothetical protein
MAYVGDDELVEVSAKSVRDARSSSTPTTAKRS